MAKRKYIYDVKTKNISFLQTAKDLKLLGIVNYMFFLKLYDTSLVGVDPHAKNLTDEQRMRIINECVINPWYFLREVCRIPDQGNTAGIPYLLNRGNLAATFCFLTSIDFYLVLPRQIGKTQSIVAIMDWTFLFGTTDSEFMMANKSLTDANNNLKRLKEQRDLLPSYLQLKIAYDDEGKLLKETDNVRTLSNKINGNTIVTKPSAKSLEAAEGIGRGSTQTVQYFDEVEFSNHIKTIVEAAGPAYNTASKNAKRNGAAACRCFSSTPGDLDSPATIEALGIIEATCKWTEKFYDMTKEEIEDYVTTNADNGIVYIEYHYKQLGKDEKWFTDTCKTVLNNPMKIKREILLQRMRGNNQSPFDPEDLDLISEKKGRIIEEIFINKLFKLDVYEKIQKSVAYLLGIDCSTGNGGDSNAISIIDPRTLKLVAEFKSPYISTTAFKNLVYVLIKKYIPRGVLCVERNHTGEALIDALRYSDIRGNLYFDNTKDFLGDGIDQALDGQGMLKLEAAKRKTYGVYTSTKSRSAMMALLETHVQEHKDKFIGNNVIDDLLKLVRNKRGKIEAGTGFHDDCIMSYLIALYVYYYGKNLHRFGVVKGQAPDENEQNRGFVDDDEYIPEEYSKLQTNSGILTQADYDKKIMEEIRRARQEMSHIDSILKPINLVQDYSESEYDGGFDEIGLDFFDDLNS